MTNYEVIKSAIKNKQQITATYQGYYREMCPHTLGSKNGRKQCLFYQFGGTSKSGLSTNPLQNWRCIPIDELENVSARDGHWHTAGNHSKPSTCVDVVDIEVVY